MPREARTKSVTGIYHIMWRGANRQELFHDDNDCSHFLYILYKYKEKAEIKVYAWCLMDNHVHLLLKEGNEEISKTMKRIGISFVSYYNSKYGTTGHLFQDRFKSESVETGKYLMTVIRYIHQNPVKAGIAKHVIDWKWSSCLGYYGKDYNPRGLLNSDYIFKMFSDNIVTAKERFREFNERSKNDQCLDEPSIRKLSDQEARQEINKVLGKIEIAHVKSLPKIQRDNILRSVKTIKGISQRQAARILGVSPNLIYRA